MPSSTISIAFKLDGDNTGFKTLAKDADGLRTAMGGVVKQSDTLTKSLNFAAISQGIAAASKAFGQLQSAMKSLTDAYAVQQTAETKLATVMRQRMDASNDEIESIKELAAEQQKLGVIGDEVQLSGAQQMATFLSTTDSIRTLLPAMNDLLAQQEGLNASTSSAESIAKAMGKAMEGSTDSLKRMGITFTDAQANVMKFGTEEDRAAMLAAVITNNVGGMNAALAATDSGKQQQLANRLSDVKERIGEIASGYMPFVTIAAQAATAAGSIATLTKGFSLMGAATKIASAATKAWSVIQIAFNAVMTANPVAMIVVAVGALVAAVIAAYKHCDKFREICDKVWAVIKQVAKVVWDSLVKAFNAVSGALQKAWNWLKKFLGIKDKEVDVNVNVNDNSGKIDTSGLEDSYADTGIPAANSNDKVWHDEVLSINDVNDNLAILRERLNAATTDEERAEINALIETYEALQTQMQNTGKTVKDNSTMWHDEVLSINDVNDNLDILQDAFNNAVTDEARARIKEQINYFQGMRGEMQNVGDAVDDCSDRWYDEAQTIGQLESNLAYLQKRQKDATGEELALINQQIQGVQDEIAAYKELGIETEKTCMSVSDGMRDAWSHTQNLTSGIESLNDALTENSSVWDKITGVINSFLQIYDSVSGVIDIIKEMTQATQAQGVAQETQGAIAAAAAGENVAASAAEIGAETAEAASASTAATSEMTLAAAKTMSAHASIPFVGIAMAAASIAAMIATMLSMPKLASGGLATGPTLAMVGEYSGAASNPEVIAPLSKLRSMLRTDDDRYGQVEFKIEGRTLVGVLNKVGTLSARR